MVDYQYKDIRNFYFENEFGKRLDCQKVNGNLFFHNVTGLGYEKEIDYVQIGNTFLKNKEVLTQNVISGELEFYEMTYDEYKKFIDFVLQAEKLKLIYIPKRTQRTEFYRDIDVIKVEQNGEDDYNIITSPISICCKSLWYEANNVICNIENIEGELRWDFEWDSKFIDYENRTFIFENEGHVEAPFLLELRGVLNPSIEIFVNSKKINELKLNILIEEDEKLLYCTKDDDLYLYKILARGEKVNLFNDLDLNNINFFKLPKGVSEIKLSAENEILNAKLTIFAEYIAV